MHKLYSVDDIPTEDQDEKFYEFIRDDKFKAIANLLILNELRKYDPEAITSEACKVSLAKMKAYQELLDLPSALLNKPEEIEED